ncbi:hypothetical protein B0H19DRAFT_1060281 [Mycena capillaripes]|nr:hypothetical protein B0H19DRAFT_1060281 [Mycena capillaripes]
MAYKRSKFLARAIERLERLVDLQQHASDVPGYHTLPAHRITWNHSKEMQIAKMHAEIRNTITGDTSNGARNKDESAEGSQGLLEGKERETPQTFEDDAFACRRTDTVEACLNLEVRGLSLKVDGGGLKEYHIEGMSTLGPSNGCGDGSRASGSACESRGNRSLNLSESSASIGQLLLRGRCIIRSEYAATWVRGRQQSKDGEWGDKPNSGPDWRE